MAGACMSSESEEAHSSDAESDYEYEETDGHGSEETDGDVSEAESEDYEVKTDHPVSLFTALRVYAMADKFDVPGLMLLARHRFYHSAVASLLTYDELPAVFDELYNTTSPNDYFMREIPARLVAAAVFSGNLLKRLKTVMIKHHEFVGSVFKYHTEVRRF